MSSRFLAVFGVFFSLLVTAAPAVDVAVAADADALPERVSGRILLNIEGSGEAFYVSPQDHLRYSLGRPEQAFAVMRAFGLGISNKNLQSIPTQVTGRPPSSITRRLSGRILIAVENHGEAWYVNPKTLTRLYLGRPQDALDVMRATGLGITREDLAQIDQGEIIDRPIATVPFIAQAPRGDWSDLRQQEGCEEASVLMAIAYKRGLTFSPEQAEAAITSMSEFERNAFGDFVDTSAADTQSRLLESYWSQTDSTLVKNVNAVDVLAALAQGNMVILPVNGQLLNNPYFQGGGPLRHMVVVYGYNYVTGEFLTHEPGISHGEDYRYSFQTIELAMNDYNSGRYMPLPQPPRTAMITIPYDS